MARPKIIDLVEGPQKLTRRQLKEKELLALLKRVKPHVAESIIVAAGIMNNATAKDESRLRAATLLLQQYRDLIQDVYSGKETIEGEEGDEDGDSAVFSLKVVNNETETEE